VDSNKKKNVVSTIVKYDPDCILLTCRLLSNDFVLCSEILAKATKNGSLKNFFLLKNSHFPIICLMLIIECCSSVIK